MSRTNGPRTREALVAAALERFAARGFYGASIAEIARELGITKQALLHHFATKEGLYGEVLAGVSARLMELVNEVEAQAPGEQGLALAAEALFDHFGRAENDARVILRELLDNSERADRSRKWYLREFLDTLVRIARTHPAWQSRSETEVLAGVYDLVGAINYFAVSRDTLRNMYGEGEYRRLHEAFPGELKRLLT